MADTDDKEHAEKLAAAKKRFEQLKKKGKKTGAKKKDDKSEGAKDDAPADAADDFPEEHTAPETEHGEVEASADSNVESPARNASLSLQSRERSESFRRGPGEPLISPSDEVQDIYRKQTARIEELERENRSVKDAQDDTARQLAKAEEELERLREGNGDAAELKSKASLADERAKEIERLTSELTSTQRQLSQAQQSAASKARRTSSVAIPSDFSEQLASKTSTIESLELELSNLRNQLNIAQSNSSRDESRLKELEQKATAAETTASIAERELDALRATLSDTAQDSSKTAEEDPAELNKKIALLQSDLRTAHSSADAAAMRAASLEQKIEALTKLHKESTATTAIKEKDVKDLKTRLKTLTASKAAHDDGVEDIEDLEDEEREKLYARIRDLEAETFELRRGVWRDQRTALQPVMPDPDGGQTSPGYEDIDLNGTPYAARQTMNARTSSFQDVLQSGISAFTGRDRAAPSAMRERGQSLGLLSEEGFDEDAFRVAQEEEGRKRVERIREVKRGLEQWRGWRVDLVDLRAAGLGGGGAAVGPVFDV